MMKMPFVLLLGLLATACATQPPHSVSTTDRAGSSPFARFVAHGTADYRRHYDADSLHDLLPPLLVAGGLANSNADRWIRDTWQNDARNKTSDELGRIFIHAGDVAQNRWSVPAYTLGMLSGGYRGDPQLDSPLATWSERSLRANLLGGPQAWALTYLLGSHRPDAGTSGWNPWNDNNGVSGHSYYGAVPFLTAARMSESAAWRYTLVAASTLPAWARVNANKHYTSQAVMGWWLAWLATGTVAEEPGDASSFAFVPVLTEDGGYVLISVAF